MQDRKVINFWVLKVMEKVEIANGGWQRMVRKEDKEELKWQRWDNSWLIAEWIFHISHGYLYRVHKTYFRIANYTKQYTTIQNIDNCINHNNKINYSCNS